MAGVIAVGYEPGPFLPGQPAVPAFSSPLRREDLDAFVACAADALEAHGDVVVVYPAWAAEPTLQRLQTARAALATSRLLAHGAALPPLAGAVLAGLAATLGVAVPSGAVVLAALPALARQLVHVTWIRRLSALRDPAPSVLQHAASLWPRTRFAVSSWPEPRVQRLSVKAPFVALPHAQARIGVALAAHPHADEGAAWLRAHVVPALGGRAVVESPPGGLAQMWWGTDGAAELVAYPLDVAPLVRALGDTPALRVCQWCGQDVVEASCPFCRFTPPVARGAEGREAA